MSIKAIPPKSPALFQFESNPGEGEMAKNYPEKSKIHEGNN